MTGYFKPKQGHCKAGDCYFKDEVNDVIRYIMIDPLGHGNRASALSVQAIEAMKLCKKTEVTEVIAYLKACFQRTRGLAMSFAFFNKSLQTLEIALVGNVHILVLTDRHIVKFRSSQTYIGNSQSTKVTIHSHKVAPLDKLLMFTDGIQYPTKIQLDLISDMTPRHIVNALANQWNGEDDVGILCEYLNDG